MDATYFFHSEKDDVVSEGYSTPVPTHDFWKKSELLKPPSRSPSLSHPHSPVDLDSFGGDYCSVADTLHIVSDMLDEDTCSSAPLATAEISLNSLKSKLIQDCMWNGSNYESALGFKVVAATLNHEDLYDTLCSTPPSVEYASLDCVDPATVFPYLINESHQNLCASHTSSDSEEEIDVEAIKKSKRKRLPQVTDEPPAKRIKPVAMKPKAVTSLIKESKKDVERKNSFTLRIKPVAMKPKAVTSLRKESKKNVKRQNSSTSDEERDISKRANHNLLERKRRNELKKSFHILREEVPEVKYSQIATTVTILIEAKNFVDKLKKDEARLLAKLAKERQKNEELLDRLYALGQSEKNFLFTSVYFHSPFTNLPKSVYKL